MNINDNELKNILKLNNILKSNDEVTATTIHEEHMKEVYYMIAKYESTISKLNEENNELKRLLKIAVEDVYELCYVSCQSFDCCDFCTHNGDLNCNHCFDWKDYDETKKWIGDVE